jgi:hypothetical protein
MKVALLVVLAACGGARTATIAFPTTAPSAQPETLLGRPLTRRCASIDELCAPFTAEEATPSNGACENTHGACSASAAKDVVPVHASIVRWNHGSSSDRHEDIAIETARGVFMVGLDLTIDDCDPEESGPPNGHASLALDRGFLVVTYDAFQRSVHLGPDSPPSKKQTCSVRCDAQAVPRCTTPACGDWSDVPW